MKSSDRCAWLFQIKGSCASYLLPAILGNWSIAVGRCRPMEVMGAAATRTVSEVC